MADKCYKCFRPAKTCLCKDITPIDPGIKFVLLMHPHEAYKEKTGTGRLTHLSLTDSEIIIDSIPGNNKRVLELISNEDFYPMLLYPGNDAHFAEDFDFKKFSNRSKLLIFLVDATWIMARKMMFRSPKLKNLPKLSFSREYRSRFEIKKQPAEYCLSTIESTYYLIKELQESSIVPKDINPDGLMNVFKKMVKTQIDCKVRY